LGILRLVLALSVVMSHGLTTFLGMHLFDGAGAVWTFFAISGFLITIALSNKYRFSEHHLVHFYWNRVIRLYPAYWLWLALTIATLLVIPAASLPYQRVVNGGSIQATGFWADHANGASLSTLVVAILSNITGFFSDALLSLGLDKKDGRLIADPKHAEPIWAMGFIFIGQFWSIGVELFFYAIAPMVTKSLPRIAVLFLLSASGWLEKAWIGAGEWCNFSPAIIYLQAPKYLWMFMIGSTLGHVFLNAKASELRKNLWWPASLVLIMYAYVASRGSVLFPIQTFPWWVFSLLTAALPVLFIKTGGNKFDRFAGDLSYPVYVNHFILIQVFGSFMIPNGLVFVIVSIIFATATIVFVERPSRRLKF
jgi:peptidoglycan/LPS O-acetylase OafA/YrhL